MPPRPEGTDGSDWSYREVVADRYKRMAVNMSATFLLHQFQSAVLALKLGWYLIPVIVDGRSPSPFLWAFLAFLVVGNICFYAGRPRGRCVLPLMKVAALLVMGTVGLHVVALWKYHLLEPKSSHTSRMLYKELKDQGKLTSASWLKTFEVAELVLDAGVAIASGLCFFTFNNWVRDAMEAAKEVEERTRKAGVRAPPAAAASAARKRR